LAAPIPRRIGSEKNIRKKPAKERLCVLAQFRKMIPSHATSKIARELGEEQFARSFDARSHVVCLLFLRRILKFLASNTRIASCLNASRQRIRSYRTPWLFMFQDSL